MSDARLHAIRDLIQEDIGRRGLATDPARNLVNAFPGDFAAACRSVAAAPQPAVVVVTGFYIPTAQPPAGETDGPLGALFLARALTALGARVALVTDGFCRAALETGLSACGLAGQVPLLTLPPSEGPWTAFLAKGWPAFVRDSFRATHLVALERVGPSHNEWSIQRQLGFGEGLLKFLHEVPAMHHDRCHTMRGIDITDRMSPAHLLFEAAPTMPGLTTIGIGDGGNEIGMGKIAWDVIRRNVPGGALVACRVATDHLIVCGISNWGAYGLGVGTWVAREQRPPVELFDAGRERALLEKMVLAGPLVDGVLGRPSVSVDGVAFERYAEQLRQMGPLAVGQ
jgi:hypothetical protein